MSTQDAPMFSVREAAKRYPGGVALAPTTLDIDVGERVAVVGPSGGGKTTLLHLLAGVIQPDEGAIYIKGRPLTSINPGRDLARLVGVIHQEHDLVPHLSVIHNVLAGRLGEWSLPKALLSLVIPQEKARAVRALEQTGIASKLYQRTSRLSGGEKQRVAIARLLVQSPEAFLADEPVASLDPARAEDLVKLLTELVADTGRTLVASLHIVELARAQFQRIIGLRNGEVVFDLPASQVTDAMLEGLYNLRGLRDEVQVS
ncbi:MAG: phnC [Dehalococcoidia bacterium]|nr:phnC [Dehalococcoidia bacterium]